MRVEWLKAALSNLDDEAAHIAASSLIAAGAFIRAVHADIERLSAFPGMGREGRAPGIREWPMTDSPYLIPYRVRDDRLQILRIFHTRRHAPRRW